MSDPIETALGKLRAMAPDHDLGQLESAVWQRIDARDRNDLFHGRTIQVQFAVTCVALLLGLFVADFVRPGVDFRSEMAVLSDDGSLAPSSRLEGGM